MHNLLKENNITLITSESFSHSPRNQIENLKVCAAFEISGHPVIRDYHNSRRMTKFTNLVIRWMTKKCSMLFKLMSLNHSNFERMTNILNSVIRRITRWFSLFRALGMRLNLWLSFYQERPCSFTTDGVLKFNRARQTTSRVFKRVRAQSCLWHSPINMIPVFDVNVIHYLIWK